MPCKILPMRKTITRKIAFEHVKLTVIVVGNLSIWFFHLFLLQLACRIISIATHYFLSASFCWMLAEGIHIYNKIVRVFSNKKYNKVFFVLGWGKCNSKKTWPASMQIYWNKRKRLHQKRVQFPQDWFGTPTWPSFYCFGTSIWQPWRHVKTLSNVKTTSFRSERLIASE